MSQAGAQAYHYCTGFICLLCMASTAPGTAHGIEQDWPPALPGLHIQQPGRTIGPLTVDRPADAGTPARSASGGLDWKAPPARGTDWPGIKKDTWYFLGYQFAAIGVLYVAPEGISGWNDEQKDSYSFAKWRDNVSNPHWDEDRWWINYILHPYWGGAYYVRARERGFDHRQSFLYSALLSTLFEFGAESLFEAPSYQDLIVTPVGGYLVGRYLFEPLRERIRAQPGAPDWTDKTLLFLTDPLGVVNVQMDRILGVDADIGLQLGPMSAHGRWPDPGQTGHRQLEDPRNHGRIQGWGLHVRLSW